MAYLVYHQIKTFKGKGINRNKINILHIYQPVVSLLLKVGYVTIVKTLNYGSEWQNYVVKFVILNFIYIFVKILNQYKLAYCIGVILEFWSILILILKFLINFHNVWFYNLEMVIQINSRSFQSHNFCGLLKIYQSQLNLIMKISN